MPAGAGRPACTAVVVTTRGGWNSPDQAARWGRIAVYLAMVAPISLRPHPLRSGRSGVPLGMGEEQFRLSGQESGKWIGGALFLGNFILVGAVS